MGAMKERCRVRRVCTITTRMIVDAVLIAGAMALAFWLRFEGAVPARMIPVLWRTIVLAIGIKIPVLFLFRARAE
jgi:hypothetical protein